MGGNSIFPNFEGKDDASAKTAANKNRAMHPMGEIRRHDMREWLPFQPE